MSTDAPPTSLLRTLAEDLRERREKIKLGGGPEKIAAQHAQEKLTARERLALLIDDGTFVELGIHGQPHFSQRAMEGREAPADGVITGYGKVDGRLVAVAAYDFTVMAGSMGMTGELKVTRLREIALTQRMPMVWLLDSAGARIQEAVGSLFAGSGHLFREEVINSGVIPQVAALMGPCAAGTAYIPGLADFVPMVKGRGSMALAGPHLVRAAVGEDVTQEELGGSRVHCRKSGVGDLEVADDPECIQAIKQYLSYFPQHCEEAPPVAPTDDPIDRGDDELLDILPDSNRQPYDMYEVIRRIVDDGVYFDLKPQFARTIITCLARFGGRPAGIVANQPRQLGGILDNDSADKAARFINLCNAFGIPLVYLMDVPGFMVGTKVEEAGIIRHGAKMLYATANATVPKVTVVLRKAYGAGYYVMCGRAYEPDLIVAWPSAEISVMGPEGAIEIIFRKQVQEAEDPEAKRRELIEQVRGIIDVYRAAGNAMIDDVIDPRETRLTICRALEMTAPRRSEDRGSETAWCPCERGEAERLPRAGCPRPPSEAPTGGRQGLTLQDPVVITCAISGAIANREQCPAIPYTPEEYAAEARRIVDEGGVHIHIHARRPDGTPSYEVADFLAIRDTIVGEVGDAAIINFSTGTIGVSVARRVAYLEAGRPEVAALNMGSMNYAKYSRKRRDFVFKFVFANPFEEIIELLEAMRRLGIKPEDECFDVGHVGSLEPLLDMGLLDPPLHADFVMGVLGGIPASAKNLAAMAENMPAGKHHWGVIGISRDQWMLVAAALTLGGSIRVGLEDNLYLPNGEMARSNGELIAKARQMTEDAGRRPATVEEARALLGIRGARGGMTLPLDGLRVLDLSRLLPGGFCSLLLADFGADVIKVEDTGLGDYIRWSPPYYEGAQETARSAPFLALNRGKRSIRLDLKSDEGREVLIALARGSDVLIESFRPGVMDRLGVGHERLAEANPGLVYCAITGYGQDGPNRDRSGHDMNYLALNGLLGLTGGADGPPVQSAGQIADLGGGALMALVGILVALRERDRSGLGQLIDCSMFDGSLSWLAMVAAEALAGDSTPRRGGLMLAGGSVCYRPYECVDGFVAIGALEPKFWSAFCNGVGREDLIEHAFDPPGSDAHRELCEIFAARTREQWREFASEHDCCLEPVLEIDEALSSELVAAREMVVELDQPGADQRVRLLGVPVRLSRTPGDPARAPGPALGEHTEDVLREAGFSNDAIGELLASGAVAGVGEVAKGSFLAR